MMWNRHVKSIGAKAVVVVSLIPLCGTFYLNHRSVTVGGNYYYLTIAHL